MEPPKITTYVDLEKESSSLSYQLSTHFTKVEFPCFDGEDTEGWLFCCLRFFVIDHTPLTFKVKLSSLHLSRRALDWHQSVLKSKGIA